MRWKQIKVCPHCNYSVSLHCSYNSFYRNIASINMPKHVCDQRAIIRLFGLQSVNLSQIPGPNVRITNGQ
jgi:hypothetical protein